jgi:hypothetical protein
MFERLRLLGGVLVLSLAFLGCGMEDPAQLAGDEPSGGTAASASPAPESKPGQHDLDAELRPDLMRLEPSQVRAGDLVDLHFPEHTSRGVGYVLEGPLSEGGHRRYHLWAAAEGYDRGPGWAPFDEADRVTPAIDIHGPGPDVVPIPDTAENGEYRLCTVGAGSNFCAELVVVK